MAVSPSIVPFWDSLPDPVIYGIGLRNRMLRLDGRAFESSDGRADSLGKGDFGRNTAESTICWHGSEIAILAHSTSLSAGLAGLVARGRAQERR